MTFGVVGGEHFIATTQFNLNLAAGTYTAMTAFAQDVLIKNLTIHMPVDAIGGIAFTGISLQSSDATPSVFISSTLGALANLNPEANISWPSFGECVLLKAGKNITLTIYGGSSTTSVICDLVVEYQAVGAGGYLQDATALGGAPLG